MVCRIVSARPLVLAGVPATGLRGGVARGGTIDNERTRESARDCGGGCEFWLVHDRRRPRSRAIRLSDPCRNRGGRGKHMESGRRALGPADRPPFAGPRQAGPRRPLLLAGEDIGWRRGG